MDDKELEDSDICASCNDSEATITSVRKSILNFWNSRTEAKKNDGDS
jgi:hypothetical protein